MLVSIVLECVARLPSPPVLDWGFVLYVLWAFLLRPLSVRPIIEPTTLRIVNPVRTYRISFNEIDDLTLDVAMVGVVARSRRVLSSWLQSAEGKGHGSGW